MVSPVYSAVSPVMSVMTSVSVMRLIVNINRLRAVMMPVCVMINGPMIICPSMIIIVRRLTLVTHTDSCTMV